MRLWLLIREQKTRCRDESPDTRGQDPDRELMRISARRTRRSFLVMAAAAGGGYWLYSRLGNSRQIGMLQWPLRRAEEYNAALFSQIFRERDLAPTYSLSRATDLRAERRCRPLFGSRLEYVAAETRRSRSCRAISGNTAKI